MLKLDQPFDRLPAAIRSYVEEGERYHVNARYKCRIRKPWYAVPSVWDSDGLLLRQAGEMPRLVHLAKKCTATDTVHRVSWYTKSLGKRHSASFMNTWTMLAAELMGRSYGGGVLELMPSEANRLPLPEPDPRMDAIFDIVDERVRARNLYSALAVVDEVVTPQWMQKRDHHIARAVLSKLILRRKSRKHATQHT